MEGIWAGAGMGWLREWKGLSQNRRVFSSVLLAASALSLWICLRVEWLNRAAGYKLPRDFSHYAPEESRAWRTPVTRPDRVREQLARVYQLKQLELSWATNRPDERSAEDVEIPKEVWIEIDRRVPEVVERYRTEIRLRDAAMVGILQYPLCLGLMYGALFGAVIGPVSLRRRGSFRLEAFAFGLAAVVGILGLVRAWQLSYVGSVLD
jgi:hypothetical protein